MANLWLVRSHLAARQTTKPRRPMPIFSKLAWVASRFRLECDSGRQEIGRNGITSDQSRSRRTGTVRDSSARRRGHRPPRLHGACREIAKGQVIFPATMILRRRPTATRERDESSRTMDVLNGLATIAVIGLLLRFLWMSHRRSGPGSNTERAVGPDNVSRQSRDNTSRPAPPLLVVVIIVVLLLILQALFFDPRN